MFCQNCGTQNADGSLFCESCGAKLEVAPAAPETNTQPAQPVQPEQPVQPTQPVPPVQPTQPVPPVQPAFNAQPVQPAFNAQPVQPKKESKLNPLMFVAIAEVIVLIIGVVVCFKNIKTANNYEKTATAFFNDLAAGKYEKAYGYLDVDGSKTLTAESFATAMETQPYAEAEKVRITKSRQTSKKATVTIKFEYDDDDYELDLDLVLKGKDSLFGGDWKISTDAFLMDDIGVYVPSGATLYMDGTEVPEKYREDDYYYKIKQAFVGAHTYYAAAGGLQSATVTSKDTYISIDALYVTEDVQDELVKLAASDIQAMADALVAGDDFSTVSSLFTDEYQSAEDNEYYFNSIRNNFFNGDLDSKWWIDGYTSVDMTNVTGYVYDVSTYSGVRVSVKIAADFAWHYMEYDIDDQIMDEDKNYTDSDYMTIDFMYVDGEWLAIDTYDFYEIGDRW